MKIEVTLSNYNDVDAYYKLRGGSSYFTPRFLDQQATASEKKIALSLHTKDTDKYSFLSSGKRAFAIGDHFIHFCYTPFEKLATTLSEPDFAFDDNESLHRYLLDLFGDRTAVASFMPSLGEDFEKGFGEYFHYLCDLKREYLTILEFCFDMDFYPEQLLNLSPLQRLSLYMSAHSRPFDHVMQKTFSRQPIQTDIFADRSVARVLRAEKLAAQNNLSVKENVMFQNDFERKYDLGFGILDVVCLQEKTTAFHYRCSNLEQFLYLEFASLCEQEFKIKRCGRCGRYFILKGNYPVEYCDRKAESGRTCQQLAAGEKYKQKTQENKAWLVYSKYYKRYFARVGVGSIKADIFKKWQYQATAMRDECIETEGDATAFERWCYDSFPNRARKELARVVLE